MIIAAYNVQKFKISEMIHYGNFKCFTKNT